jgi:hypothetical protein
VRDTTTTITPTPFEAMLEELHAATVTGDDDRAAELRAAIENDLATRERALVIREAR